MGFNKKKAIILFVVFITNFGIDQWSKVWAREHVRGFPVKSYFDGFFKWVYAENTGAFLSLGSGLPGWTHTLLLIIIPLIMIVGIFIYALLSKEVTQLQGIGFGFIAGGGLSNLYDRIMYGAVTDFMNMGLFDLRTGIFNYADVAILIGVGFLLVFYKK